MIKKAVKAAFVLLIALTLAEIAARSLLGLGGPPLYIEHPTIEYMLRPDQDVRRLGKRYLVNSYGMRSEAFGMEKIGPRILVFGDSVVNGGGQTDQKDLATSLVKRALVRSGFKDVMVGNISATSWGPGNWLAYAKEYGFFHADAVVLVLSSHDAADNPAYQPFGMRHPTQRPLLALQEGISRHLYPWVKEAGLKATAPLPHDQTDAVRKGLADLEDFLRLAMSGPRRVLVFQHLTRTELTIPEFEPGFEQIRSVCVRLGLSPVSLAPYFKKALAGGQNPYRDDIHLNTAGQLILAEAIAEHLGDLSKLAD